MTKIFDYHHDKPSILGPDLYTNPLRGEDTDELRSAFGTFDDTKPATYLGANLYSNPLFDAKTGQICSAFGEIVTTIDDGPTYGIVRILEQVSGTRTPATNPEEIVSEILLLTDGLIDTYQGFGGKSRTAQRLTNYLAGLSRAYADTGGSSTLLVLSKVFGHVEPGEVAALKGVGIDYEAGQKFARLHPPQDEKQEALALKAEVLPLLPTQKHLHDFIATLASARLLAATEISSGDTVYSKKLLHLLMVCGEQLDEFTFHQLAEWATTKKDLIGFATAFTAIDATWMSEKRAHTFDLAAYKMSCLPLIDYFSRDTEAQSSIDFEKARAFIEFCEKEARKGSAHDIHNSHFVQVAKHTAGAIIESYNRLNSRSKKPTAQVIEERCLDMLSAGIRPVADAEIFVYTYATTDYLGPTIRASSISPFQSY